MSCWSRLKGCAKAPGSCKPRAVEPRKLQVGSLWALRIALSATFLSAVADRLGLWGPPGAAGVAWGDWAHFRAYSDQLNAWAPAWLQGVLALAATAAELLLALALIALPRHAWASAAAAVLLCVFALSMTFTIGPKAPLDYSVWVGAAAAWLLATSAKS